MVSKVVCRVLKLLLALRVLKNSLDYLKGLSPKLQRRDIDVFETYR